MNRVVEKASTAYSRNAEEFIAVVKSLEALIGDFVVDARKANWEHVGTMVSALDKAQALHDLMTSVAAINAAKPL